jgi:hypothetical protein
MAGELIVARFRDAESGQRAAADLKRAGVQFEIHADPGGAVVVSVRPEADDPASVRIRTILERQAPKAIESRPIAPEAERATTLSGAPADHGISAGTLPEAEQDGDWLVRQEGELAREVDPDPEPNQP